MQEFLIILPLPENVAPLADRFIRAAIAFLETVGPVERVDVGVFQRSARKGQEVTHLVALTTPVAASAKDLLEHARAVEDVLRAALGAAKTTTDVRVVTNTRHAVPSASEAGA